MNKNILIFLPIFTLALASCEEMSISPKAHFNRGSPESLLGTSSEQITVSLSGKDAIRQLSEWTASDLPSHAELQCDAWQSNCKKAMELLKSKSVPFTQTPTQIEAKALLAFDRITARDCEHRFIDQRRNSYNLNYPTFGCATAANMVQQVSDKRQFINPSLKGNSDAAKAVQVFNNYMTPPKVSSDEDSESILKDLQQSGGSSGR